MTIEKAIPIAIGIVVTILGSLVAYVFYGFINLSAEVKTLHPVIKQQDINTDKVDMIKDYYQFKVDEEKRWVDFYKDKSE
jgi:hypothetical protein